MTNCYKMTFNEKDILNLEVKSLLNTLCGIKTDNLVDTSFIFGILNVDGRLHFYLTCNNNFTSLLHQKWRAIYPQIEYEKFNIEYFENKLRNDSKFFKLKLAYKDDKKIVIQDQEITFINNLLSSIYSKDSKSINMIEMSFQPITTYEYNKKQIEKKVITKRTVAKALLKATQFAFSAMLSPNIETKEKLIEVKEEIVPEFKYNVSIKIGVRAIETSSNELIVKLRNIAGIYSQLNDKNIFLPEEIDYNEMFNRQKYDMKLSTDEISQFLFLPPDIILDRVLGASVTKILEDKNVPEKGIPIGISQKDKLLCFPTPNIILNVKEYPKIYSKYESKIDDIVKPKLVMGLPGCGKSEWLVNKAVGCLNVGLPFILMDPKYDTQKRLIESVSEEQLKNIDFINLGDLVYPPALNIFRRRKKNDATENGLVTTNFVEYMKKQFSNSWGYNIERMVKMTTDAILLDDISTLTEFYWMLTEPLYRETIIQIIENKLEDPDCKSKSWMRSLQNYWRDFDDRFKKNPMTVKKEIEPIMNKIGVFIGNRFINAIVSQRESYDFKNSGDIGRSVIINVPEGIISHSNMSLLCGFINKAIWMDFQSRDDMDIINRFPVEWIIDEAHTIIDDEIVGILQKARSRRLGMILSGQNLSTLDMKGTKLSNAISDICKDKVIFRIGYQDARFFADEFAPLTPKDLNECPKHHFYSKILLPDGTVSKPFFAKPLPMAKKIRDYDTYVQKHHSGKMTIDQIEDDIENRLESIRIANTLMGL